MGGGGRWAAWSVTRKPLAGGGGQGRRGGAQEYNIRVNENIAMSDRATGGENIAVVLSMPLEQHVDIIVSLASACAPPC